VRLVYVASIGYLGLEKFLTTGVFAADTYDATSTSIGKGHLGQRRHGQLKQTVRFLLTLLSLALGCAAHAHLISAGNGLINILPERAVLLIAVPVSVFQNVDTNQDGLLQAEEIKLNRERIIDQLSRSIDFRIGASRGDVLDDQIMVSVHADNAQGTPQIEWLRQMKFAQEDLNLPISLSFKDRLLSGEYLIQVKRVDGQALAKISPAHPSHIFFNNGWGTFQSFFQEGWQHIVGGYDHLVFLITLLAASMVWKRWFWMLTSFTLAHGMTYGMASYGLLQVQPSLIEPVIALTIVLMASLSLFKVKVGLVSEAWVVFGLGLFHGLGFASAMSTQLQGQIFPLASVLGFNLGIEAGQIAVCLILGLFFQLLQRSPQWLEKVRIWTLWAGFMAGAFWLFERI
jgi:hydrogenase/urease accessory protein HupE